MGRHLDDLDAVLEFDASQTLGNWFSPFRRRQVFAAAETSLKTMASAVLFERHPFDRVVRWRTVAKVLSIGLVTGMRMAVPISRRGFLDRGIWCDHPGRRHREHEGVGRPMHTMSCELVLVAGRLCDSPGCAVSANP